MTKHKQTQNSRVFAYLFNGAQPTAGELRTRLKIQNPTAVIANMRSVMDDNHSIFDIYSNTRKNSRGESVIRYRLGYTRGFNNRVNPFDCVTLAAE